MQVPTDSDAAIEKGNPAGTLDAITGRLPPIAAAEGLEVIIS